MAAPGDLTVILNNKIKMPLIGFGTFTIRGRELIYQVIDAALKNGYRSIDTAAVYRNEEDIGYALKKLLPKYNLQREDIFLTSKLAPGEHGRNSVRPAFLASLERLDTPYLDLYLVHWPGVTNDPRDRRNSILRSETWAQLELLHRDGLLRSIGVSNFTENHLRQLSTKTVLPTVNQVELHPHYQQKSLLKYCRAQNIHVQAYSSLGGHSSAVLLADPVVRRVAQRAGKSPSQVLLRWALQQEIGVIPKSVDPSRIAANIDLDFELSPDCMEELSSVKHTQKYAWDPTNVA